MAPRKEAKADHKDDANTIWESRKIILQVNLKSRTLICYFTNDGSFHFGFGYENGSNVRVKILEENCIVNKTTHRAFVLAFPDCIARHGVDNKNERFTNEDFDFPWFNRERRDQAEKELKTVEDFSRNDGETLCELVYLFSQLNREKSETFMRNLKENLEDERDDTTNNPDEKGKDETDDNAQRKAEKTEE